MLRMAFMSYRSSVLVCAPLQMSRTAEHAPDGHLWMTSIPCGSVLVAHQEVVGAAEPCVWCLTRLANPLLMPDLHTSIGDWIAQCWVSVEALNAPAAPSLSGHISRPHTHVLIDGCSSSSRDTQELIFCRQGSDSTSCARLCVPALLRSHAILHRASARRRLVCRCQAMT